MRADESLRGVVSRGVGVGDLPIIETTTAARMRPKATTSLVRGFSLRMKMVKTVKTVRVMASCMILSWGAVKGPP